MKTDSTLGEFGGLYEQYLPRIYGFVSYRIGNRETAEDLTSDIFYKALSGFTQFDSKKASFSTWLFSIARNTIIDYYRKRGIEQRYREESASESFVSPDPPDEETSRFEDIDKLRECLSRLKPNEQELISLKFSGEMTNREIAQITGLSESNVGTILCRAIRKLRDDFARW